MKILTILIFSGNRLSVKDLLGDIVKLNQLINIDIRIKILISNITFF